MNTFTINNKIYSAKPFSVGTVCDLEDMGVDFEESANKPFGLMRKYFMICSNLDEKSATKELDNHISNGGSLEPLMNAMSKEMDESDFFRSFSKTTETETTTTQRKKKNTTA